MKLHLLLILNIIFNYFFRNFIIYNFSSIFHTKIVSWMYPFFNFFYKKSNSSPTCRKPTTSCYLFVKEKTVSSHRYIAKTVFYKIKYFFVNYFHHLFFLLKLYFLFFYFHLQLYLFHFYNFLLQKKTL